MILYAVIDFDHMVVVFHQGDVNIYTFTWHSIESIFYGLCIGIFLDDDPDVEGYWKAMTVIDVMNIYMEDVSRVAV
jgi:hypothetical protein